MPRHYSKVLVEFPDGPSDPPYAVVSIECDVCEPTEIRIHVAHLGTVLRVLSQTIDDLEDNGTTEAATGTVVGTPADKAAVLDYLNRTFPGWKVGRLRRGADR